MPVIQGGRWQRFLQKYFGIVGEVVASELAPEIYATLNIESFLDDDVLQGWNTFTGFIGTPTGAAAVTYNQIQNPAGSGVIVVVERVTVHTATTANLTIAVSLGDTLLATGLKSCTSRDKRVSSPTGIRTVSTAKLTGQNTGIAGGGAVGPILTPNLVSGATSRFEDPAAYVLMPGDAQGYFACDSTGTGVNNTNQVLSVWWRERKLESSETTA